MRVDISGHKFVFPHQCACCSAMPQTTLTASASKSTGKRVIHTTSKSWDFPYCIHCVNHVRVANTATVTTTCTIVVTLIAASYLFFLGALAFGLILGIAGIVGGIFTYNLLMTEAKKMCGPNCTCVQSAVRYIGWYGSCHMFEIASSGYALAFMVANRNKLVNLRPEVLQWLQANGYGVSPHQPQSARRYIH